MLPMDHLPKGMETNERFLSNYTYLQSNYSGSVTQYPNTMTLEIPHLITKPA